MCLPYPVSVLLLVALIANDLAVTFIEAAALHLVWVTGVFNGLDVMDSQAVGHSATLAALPLSLHLQFPRQQLPCHRRGQLPVSSVFCHVHCLRHSGTSSYISAAD